MTKEYLGDGLYAEIDNGFQIKLTADSNQVYLEESVFARFISYAIKNKWLSNKKSLCAAIDHFADPGKKPRDLIKCHCNDCGSSYEVMYDMANDYYICKGCVDKEEEEDSDEEE